MKHRDRPEDDQVSDPHGAPRDGPAAGLLIEASEGDMRALSALWQFVQSEHPSLSEALRDVPRDSPAFAPLHLLEPPFAPLLTDALGNGRFEELRSYLETKGAEQARAGAFLDAWRPALRSFQRVVLERIFAAYGGAEIASQEVLSGLHVFADLLVSSTARGILRERDRMARIALDRSSEQVRSANEELLRFAYTASHDLAEPLRAVRGFAQLLDRQYEAKLDEDGRRFLRHIVSGAVRMQQLIDDLLAFSRAGRTDVERVTVETAQLCDEAIARLSTEIEAASAAVTHEGLPRIEAPRAVTQIFYHLIANALKFRSGASPRVRIFAIERDDVWEFFVEDNGIGIAEKYWGRIFQAFERLHARDEIPGSGIGLAVVKRIVQRAGGEASVRSVLGEGSTFSFTIPKYAPV